MAPQSGLAFQADKSEPSVQQEPALWVSDVGQATFLCSTALNVRPVSQTRSAHPRASCAFRQPGRL